VKVEIRVSLTGCLDRFDNEIYIFVLFFVNGFCRIKSGSSRMRFHEVGIAFAHSTYSTRETHNSVPMLDDDCRDVFVFQQLHEFWAMAIQARPVSATECDTISFSREAYSDRRPSWAVSWSFCS
jgi:hypothetical protein